MYAARTLLSSPSKARALLRLQNYRDLCNHEYLRPSNKEFFADVYDSPAWQKFMGPATLSIVRIGLQCCVDAIPAFAIGTLSLKPVCFINLSLPPALRGAVKNALLLMLQPASLKGGQSKKYYDFASEYELNDLYHKGLLCIAHSILL